MLTSRHLSCCGRSKLLTGLTCLPRTSVERQPSSTPDSFDTSLPLLHSRTLCPQKLTVASLGDPEPRYCRDNGALNAGIRIPHRIARRNGQPHPLLLLASKPHLALLPPTLPSSPPSLLPFLSIASPVASLRRTLKSSIVDYGAFSIALLPRVRTPYTSAKAFQQITSTPDPFGPSLRAHCISADREPTYRPTSHRLSPDRLHISSARLEPAILHANAFGRPTRWTTIDRSTTGHDPSAELDQVSTAKKMSDLSRDRRNREHPAPPSPRSVSSFAQLQIASGILLSVLATGEISLHYSRLLALAR